MDEYGDRRIRCIKRYSDSKESYKKREKGGTCLILELMHRLIFISNDSKSKVYSYLTTN